MDIKEIQKLRENLEKEITQRLNNFEQTCGVGISQINYDWPCPITGYQYMPKSFLMGMSQEPVRMLNE